MTWLLFFLLSLCVYRITRFISLDSLIEEPRNWAEKKLLAAGFYTQDGEDWPVGFWRRKALQWIRCPYCQSVWVAAFALFFVARVASYEMTWMYLVEWTALAGASMIWYRFTDPSPPCLPTKECD